ncbi:hypothetical protein [Pseudoalteromonas phage XCL1123]|nr:hypothetical protein [Pseudoalteromonas phage XCL1123]
MREIKWEEGAVCFAAKKQWNSILQHEVIIDLADFQLNEIRTGDYIEASELDTEQKYNDAVGVFGLFGFDCGDYDWFKCEASRYNKFVCEDGELDSCVNKYGGCNRKITYPQLMAIGKLKRAMIEREHLLNYGNHGEKSAPKITPDLTPDVEINADWSDEHYNHFYQLTEEDIKAGQIKVDAYFVNRMWKINSWEDTGAGFHILKTLPRIANNKNSLKRELIALKKQVDILCKLHGVDDDTN